MSSTTTSVERFLSTQRRAATATPPSADECRAAYYSRECARLGALAASEARRAHAWRGAALYAFGGVLFLLGALRMEDWLLAAGVALVAATVAIQHGRMGR